MPKIVSLKIAARKSTLSRLQARLVQHEIQKWHPHLKTQCFFVSSFGDRNQMMELSKSDTKGVFTEDLREGLRKGRFDMLVHSWKDLPVESDEKSVIHTLGREDQRDLFLLKKEHWERVKKTKKLSVFTSSPRRSYQIKEFVKEGFLPSEIKETKVIFIRGNIPTRLEKLFSSSEVDALILAKAALDRLLLSENEYEKIYRGKSADKEKQKTLQTHNQIKKRLQECLWMILPLRLFPSSAAQGALAIESLKERQDVRELLASIHQKDIFHLVLRERKILQSLGGGCHQNIGVSCVKKQGLNLQFYRGDSFHVEELVPEEKQFTWPKPLEDQIFPLEERGDHFFNRLPIEEKFLPPPPEASLLWVSRQSAFPDTWRGREYFFWAAGIQTWKALSQKGLWVRGCNESLGEGENEKIDSLLKLERKYLKLKDPSWIKLTHLEAPTVDGKRNYPTYQLKALTSLPNLERKTHFYWKSSSQFLWALKAFPHIKEGFHGSGLGHSFSVIKNIIPPERRKAFLSYSSWKKHVTHHC